MSLGFQTGWGNYNSGNDDGGDSGGKMPERERLYRYRFKVPDPSKNPLREGDRATRRVLFLTGEPIHVYEHNLYKFESTKDFTSICLKQNNIHPECPICSEDGGAQKPSCIGFFVVVDMGQVERNGDKIQLYHDFKKLDNGEKKWYRFQKRLLGARKGGSDKPGMLQNLQFEAQQCGGNLQYTVWDATRSGKKVESIGDSYRFVGKLKEEQVRQYLLKWGANEDEIDLSVPDLIGTKDNPGPFFVEPVQYYNKLAKIVGWSPMENEKSSSVGAGESDGWAEEQSNVKVADDDDIPF